MMSTLIHQQHYKKKVILFIKTDDKPRIGYLIRISKPSTIEFYSIQIAVGLYEKLTVVSDIITKILLDNTEETRNKLKIAKKSLIYHTNCDIFHEIDSFLEYDYQLIEI